MNYRKSFRFTCQPTGRFTARSRDMKAGRSATRFGGRIEAIYQAQYIQGVIRLLLVKKERKIRAQFKGRRYIRAGVAVEGVYQELI